MEIPFYLQFDDELYDQHITPGQKKKENTACLQITKT